MDTIDANIILDWIGKCVPYLFSTVLLLLTIKFKFKNPEENVIEKVVNYEFYLSLFGLTFDALICVLKKWNNANIDSSMYIMRIFCVIWLTVALILLFVFICVMFFKKENIMRIFAANISVNEIYAIELMMLQIILVFFSLLILSFFCEVVLY